MIDNKTNYDITPMIDAFDMNEFLTPTINSEKQAIVMITNSQCIVSYTKDYGLGEHVYAFGNAIRVIDGLEPLTILNIISLDTNTEEKFIKARLVNDYRLGIYIAFTTSKIEAITPNQFRLFEEFYLKYNDIIKAKSFDLNTNLIMFIDSDFNEYDSPDLTPLLEYLKTKVKLDKNLPDDKNIIGNITLASKAKM